MLFSSHNSTCEIGQIDIPISFTAEGSESQPSYIFNVAQLQRAPNCDLV